MTFLTADRWTLSSPTAQVTLAEARGYFDELCLDVSIAPGDSSDNYALLAGGEASFIGGASLVELADFAGRNDRGFVAALVAAHSTEQTTDGVLVTTQRFVDLHPSAADDFVRATLRAATDLTEGPAEANAQITRWAALRNDSPALSRVTPLSTISPIVEPTALQRELDGALDAGVLEGPIATIDQLVDSAFAQRVLDDDGHLVWPGG
jgi:ABC-type nitrate/sulfonate/bicarbonate transport system substrate-binding protein